VINVPSKLRSLLEIVAQQFQNAAHEFWEQTNTQLWAKAWR